MKLASVSNGREYTGRRTITLSLPSGYRFEEAWGEAAYGHSLGGKRAYTLSRGTATAAEEAVHEAIEAEAYRQPLLILASLGKPGVVVSAEGDATVNQAPADRVSVSIRGVATTLYVERESRRVVRIEYRGRLGTQVGDVAVDYNDFRSVDGYEAPFRAHRSFDGKVLPEAQTFDSVRMNGSAARPD